MSHLEIVSICSHCGKLIHLQNNIFSSSIFKNNNSSLPPIIPFFNQKRKIILCCYNSFSFRYIKILIRAQKELTYKGVSLFPLCQDCTAIYNQQVSMMIDFLNLATNDLQTITITIPIDKIQTRIDHLTTFINFKKKKPLRKRKSMPTVTDQSKKLISIVENDETTKWQPINEESLENQVLNHIEKQTTVYPLLSFFTFYISSDHHYGTINHTRIGFFKYHPNTITENNTALFFICHLIYYFKCIFRIPQIHISFNPASVVVIQKKSVNNNIPYTSFILEYPARKTRVNEFNESINHLFQAYSLICQASSKSRSAGEPPFQIDFKQKKIERFGYFLNLKNVEEWSIAMKLFLINLKMIQYRTLRGCLDQF